MEKYISPRSPKNRYVASITYKRPYCSAWEGIPALGGMTKESAEYIARDEVSRIRSAQNGHLYKFHVEILDKTTSERFKIDV